MWPASSKGLATCPEVGENGGKGKMGRYQTLSEPKSVLGVIHWVKLRPLKPLHCFFWEEEARGNVDLGMSSLPPPMCLDGWGLGLPSLQEALPFWSCPGWRGWALEKGGVSGGMHQLSVSAALLEITLLIICHNYTGLHDTENRLPVSAAKTVRIQSASAVSRLHPPPSSGTVARDDESRSSHMIDLLQQKY